MTSQAVWAEPRSASVAARLRLSLVAAGILAGVVLGVWLTEVSLGAAAELWISYHQAIRVPYTAVVPPLGALAVIGAVAAMVGAPRSSVSRPVVVAALGCLIVGMVVTVGLHFPMNATIDSWSPTAPPAEWKQVRDDWLIAHAVRSVLALAAFMLLALAATRQERREVSRPPGAGSRPRP